MTVVPQCQEYGCIEPVRINRDVGLSGNEFTWMNTRCSEHVLELLASVEADTQAYDVSLSAVCCQGRVAAHFFLHRVGEELLVALEPGYPIEGRWALTKPGEKDRAFYDEDEDWTVPSGRLIGHHWEIPVGSKLHLGTYRCQHDVQVTYDRLRDALLSLRDAHVAGNAPRTKRLPVSDLAARRHD